MIRQHYGSDEAFLKDLEDGLREEDNDVFGVLELWFVEVG